LATLALERLEPGVSSACAIFYPLHALAEIFEGAAGGCRVVELTERVDDAREEPAMGSIGEVVPIGCEREVRAVGDDVEALPSAGPAGDLLVDGTDGEAVLPQEKPLVTLLEAAILDDVGLRADDRARNVHP
jgi:hypothetical protein